MKRLRSAILGKLEGSEDISVGQGEARHLSDYLSGFNGDIYWFACQYGAATKPDEEMRAMLEQDGTPVKRVSM